MSISARWHYLGKKTQSAPQQEKPCLPWPTDAKRSIRWSSTTRLSKWRHLIQKLIQLTCGNLWIRSSREIARKMNGAYGWHYNRKIRRRHLAAGDLVLLDASVAKPSRPGGKLSERWVGPYKVIRPADPGSYHLEDLEGQELPST